MKFSLKPTLEAGVALMVMGTAMIAAPAFAQDAAPAPAAAATPDAEGQTIIVTGSRIRRTEATSTVPVAVIGADSLQSVGQTNLLEAIQDLPIAGQTAGRTASNFSNSGNGTATINLRNLGASRTLVLINGRRSVGVPGSPAVDLNNIPTDMIDHVEIVTGGASAVYGSDAVAGVVNIILKNKFEGLQLHAQDMTSAQGDGNSVLLSATAGHKFADGRGQIIANFSYNKDDGVPSSARSFSASDSPTGSAYTPQGAFITSNGTFTFDPNNNVIPYNGSAAQRYNRASQRLLATPVERYLGSVIGHFDISPAATLYGEFTFSKVKAHAHIEPLAVDDGGNQGQSVTNFDGSAFPGISSNDPYMPAAIAQAAGPNSYVDFRKRSNGIFDRSPNDSREYYRGVVGLKGQIGSNWSYDASYEHSQVRDETINGSILMNNYGAALQAISLNGQVVCADPVARAAGCVPINPFGTQSYTAAQLKWLTTYSAAGAAVAGAVDGQSAANADYLQKNFQDVATVSVTGSLFNLPNGPLGVAAGAEYHHEHVSEVYDPFTRSGISSQQLNGNTYGTINAKEAFVELNAPIFGNHPYIYSIALEGAARYAHYSTVGSVWTYKYGGSYAPTPDIRFRSIYARAVRAPNVNELYSPQANTAQQVVDPCDQYQGGGETATAVALPAACKNIAGIANYLQTHSVFGYSLAQVQTIFGLQGGNPNLHAEATNTFTAGATITPRGLRNFLLTADYYSVKVKNAVATIDPQIAVTQCFLTGSNDFCSLVHRNANGFITEVDGVAINAASYQVAGIDVRMVWGVKPHLFGHDNVTFDVYYNHKFKQQQTPFAGGAVSNELGTADTYASQQLGTGFKDQATFNLNYASGPYSINYRLKYYGPVTASSGKYPINAYTYQDISFKIDVAKNYSFYFGVNNLFDKDPPFIKSGNSQWPGTNTVADTYDTLGQMFYAGVTAKF